MNGDIMPVCRSPTRESEIDFASRFPPRHLETCRPEISKLDLGTIKMKPQRPIYPQRVPTKKELGRFDAFGTFRQN